MKNLLTHPVTAIVLKTIAFIFLVYNFSFVNALVLFIAITGYDAILDYYKKVD